MTGDPEASTAATASTPAASVFSQVKLLLVVFLALFFSAPI
jgi:hypothetical protein